MPEPSVSEEGRSVWAGRLAATGLAIAVAVLAFLVYWGSVDNEFVWDDPIVLGQQLQAFHSMSDVFFPPPRIPQFGGLYYRPMILVSYMTDRALFGTTPFAFHFPVVLMHAVNSGLVFLLGRRLFGARTLALFAALGAAVLFATHPIHTESVCWMAGRSDTLATLFIVPSFISYLRWKEDRARWWWLALASVLFFGGCLSKETAAGFLMIVVAADILGIGEPAAEAEDRRGRERPRTAAAEARAGQGKGGGKGPRDDRKSTRKREPAAAPRSGWTIPFAGWAALGAAFVAYFALRQKALTAYPEKLTAAADPITGLTNVVKAVGFYVSKIFVPVHLDAYIPNIPMPGPSFVIGALAVSLGAAAVWLAWTRGERMIAFPVLFFVAALPPSLAIASFVISEAPVAARYLYLPSVGFCLLAGYLGFVKLPEVLARRSAAAFETAAPDLGETAPATARRALTPVVAAVAVATLAISGVYATMAIRRGQDWKADLVFWTDGAAKSPNEGLPHLHRGLALANLGRADEAEQEYLIAIDEKVEYDEEGRSTALNNLGMLYMGRNDYDKAEEYFERAIRMRPTYATPYYGIGVTTMRRGEILGRQGQVAEATQAYEKSEAYFTRSIQLNPVYVKAHNPLGYLFATTGRTKPALEHLNRVLQLVSSGQEYIFARDLKQQIEARTGQK